MREVQRISEQKVQRSMSLNPTPENEQLLRSIDACSDGVVLLDARVPRWPILFSNEGWTQVTGMIPAQSLRCPPPESATRKSATLVGCLFMVVGLSEHWQGVRGNGLPVGAGSC